MTKPATQESPPEQGQDEARRQAGLLNSLLDSIPDIIFFKDAQGVYLGCNPPFAAFVGRAREAIIGKTDYDLFPGDVADFFRDHDRRMLDKLEPHHNEEWITYPDGRKILIDTLKTPYWGPDGKLIGILGVSRDITAYKLAESALRESEANFHAFFETMTDLILVSAPDGKLLFSNTAVTRMLGYTPDELKQMHVLDLHPADKRQEAGELFAAMVKGERESCPLPLAARDGSLVPVETRVWSGHWNGSDSLFSLSKNLSAEQDANQRFEHLFRNNPSLMALSSHPDRKFTDINNAFMNVLGYPRSAVIGKTVDDLALFPQPDRQAALAIKLQAEGRVTDFELQVRRKDGVVLTGLFSGEMIQSQGRKHFLTVMNDITERKQAETERDRLLEEVTRSRKSLQSLGRRLVEIHEVNSRELASELHDRIGQNLTALGINLDLMQSLLPGDASAKFLARLKDSRHLLEETMDRVRDVMAELRSSVLDDYGLAAALRWYGDQVARRTGLVVDVHAESILPRLSADAENALFNICKEAVTNATKHARSTRITIRLERDAGGCRLTIEDNGTGFEPPPAEAGGKHTHWGLVIMAERVEAVNGRLTIRSAPGQGTLIQAEIHT